MVSYLVSLPQHLAFYLSFATQQSKHGQLIRRINILIERKVNHVDNQSKEEQMSVKRCHLMTYPLEEGKEASVLVASGGDRKPMGDAVTMVARVQIMQVIPRDLEVF